jgi:hypothetical protein
MEVHQSLPELASLFVYECQELEQVVAVNKELVQLPNDELYIEIIIFIHYQYGTSTNIYDFRSNYD